MRIQTSSFFIFYWTKENIGRCRIKQKHRAIEVPLEHSTLSFMNLLCLIQAIDLTLSFPWEMPYYQPIEITRLSTGAGLELAEHSIDQRETENFIAQQLQKT